MKYADSITKSFLTYGQPRINLNSSKILEWQDPTYLGFQWRIINTKDFTRGSGELDLDYFPQGLFLDDNDPDSAYNYFIRTNQSSRAEMIKEFRTGFIQLLKEAPWYFTTISGLGEIWKIEPGNSYRGKDKEIVIETEESIDLKITYLMDLYRKAIFDASWMRYALPENQRMFSMELIIAEVRPMQISLRGWVDLNTGNTNTGIILNDIGGLFQSAGSFAKNANQALGIGNEDLTNLGLDTAAGKIGLKAPWSTTTFLSFRFDQCTFNVFDNSPAYLEKVSKIADVRATNSITIKTPYISESHSYGLLGAVLKESYYASDYNYDIYNLDQQSRTINDTLGGKSQISTVELALRNFSSNLTKLLGLENVYGFSASQIINSIENFSNNPIEATRNVLRNFTRNGEVNPNSLGSTVLTGQEINLISKIIGNSFLNSNNANSNLVAQNLGKTVEDGINSNSSLVVQNLGISVEDNINSNSSLVVQNLGISVEDSINSNSSLVVQNLGKTVEDNINSNSNLVAQNLGKIIEDGITSNSSLVSQNLGKTIEDSINSNPNLVAQNLGISVEDSINSNVNLVAQNLPKNILTGADVIKAQLGNVYKK